MAPVPIIPLVALVSPDSTVPTHRTLFGASADASRHKAGRFCGIAEEDMLERLSLGEIVDLELDFYQDPAICSRYRAILERVDSRE